MGNSDSLSWSAFSCFEDQSDSLNDDMDFDMRNNTQQIIWEFQRFNPETGWGAGNNLMPDDPGRWATQTKDKFGDTLQSVAPPVPPNYRVDLGWAIVVQKRKHRSSGPVKASITDLFGWHYSNSFFASTW